MVEETTKFIRIDLNQFKLNLYLKPEVELTLHFDSPSADSTCRLSVS